MIKEQSINVLLLAGLLSGITNAHAAGGSMTFSGTLIDPPTCTISNGNKIEVNFGERVGVNKIDGANYRSALNYQIICKSTGSRDWTLTLSLSGDKAGFDGEALSTNNKDLGIRVYQDGKPFTPNSTLKIDLNKPPKLEAVPVKNKGSELTAGAFEAWATLRADYQ